MDIKLNQQQQQQHQFWEKQESEKIITASKEMSWSVPSFFIFNTKESSHHYYCYHYHYHHHYYHHYHRDYLFFSCWWTKRSNVRIVGKSAPRHDRQQRDVPIGSQLFYLQHRRVRRVASSWTGPDVASVLSTAAPWWVKGK